VAQLSDEKLQFGLVKESKTTETGNNQKTDPVIFSKTKTKETRRSVWELLTDGSQQNSDTVFLLRVFLSGGFG
jgi:hypothetical protein